jgi:WD40 repeat protein
VQLLPRYVLSGALDGRLKGCHHRCAPVASCGSISHFPCTVWDRDAGECRYTFAKHKGAVTCLHYDTHTRAMVSGSLDRTLQYAPSDVTVSGHR